MVIKCKEEFPEKTMQRLKHIEQGAGGVIGIFKINDPDSEKEGQKGQIRFTNNSITIKQPCIVGYEIKPFPAFPHFSLDGFGKVSDVDEDLFSVNLPSLLYKQESEEQEGQSSK